MLPCLLDELENVSVFRTEVRCDCDRDSYRVDASGIGYVLALIMEACIRYQSSSSHIDPIHVTAHYLRTTAIAPFAVHVHTLKTGKGFTNLTAELTQKVLVHLGGCCS